MTGVSGLIGVDSDMMALFRVVQSMDRLLQARTCHTRLVFLECGLDLGKLLYGYSFSVPFLVHS